MKGGMAIYLTSSTSKSLDVRLMPTDSQRDKLNKKAEKLRFVGYSTRSKGYRLLNEKTTKIKISRDVIFLMKTILTLTRIDKSNPTRL